MECQINELKEKAFRIATEHGWFDDEVSVTHDLALIMSEIGEAINAHRAGKFAQKEMFLKESVTPQTHPEKHWVFCFENFIKNTFEDELADIIIRTLTLTARNSMELPQELFTEEKLKKSMDNANDACGLLKREMTFPEELFMLYEQIALLKEGEATLDYFLHLAIVVAMRRGVDIFWHIEQKMKYNELRPYKHGKEY